MNVHDTIALLLDPSRILFGAGLTPNPWQRALLLSPERQVLLNCSRPVRQEHDRQHPAHLHTAAVFTPGGLVLLLSPSQRQSGGDISQGVAGVSGVAAAVAGGAGNADVSRAGEQGPHRLPAGTRRRRFARSAASICLSWTRRPSIPDDLYRSRPRPMLAVSQGRLVALSTP